MGLARVFINIATDPDYFSHSEELTKELDIVELVEFMCAKNGESARALRALSEQGWEIDFDASDSAAITYRADREFATLDEAMAAGLEATAAERAMDWYPDGYRDGEGEFDTYYVGEPTA